VSEYISCLLVIIIILYSCFVARKLLEMTYCRINAYNILMLISYAEMILQRSKERRSLRGRMAALVRHGAAIASSNREIVPQIPKTFGIPIHTCVMSSVNQVSLSMKMKLTFFPNLKSSL